MYKIPCAYCSWCYIGETGRAFKNTKKHFRNVKTAAKVIPGHTITLLIFTLLSLIKNNVILEQERHWKRGIPNGLPMWTI